MRLGIDAKEVGDPRILPGESFEVWLSVPDGLHIRTIFPPSLGSRDIRCVSLEFDVPLSDKDFRITGLPRSAATMTTTLDVLSPQDPVQRQESVLRGRVKLLPITTQAFMYSREIDGPGSEKELLDRVPVFVETGWLLLQLVPVARGEECRLYAADPTVGLAVHRPNHPELWPMIGEYYTTEPHQTPTPPQPLQTESGQLLHRAPSDSSFMWDVGKVRYLLLCPKKIPGSKALEIARLTHEVGTPTQAIRRRGGEQADDESLVHAEQRRQSGW